MRRPSGPTTCSADTRPWRRGSCSRWRPQTSRTPARIRSTRASRSIAASSAMLRRARAAVPERAVPAAASAASRSDSAGRGAALIGRDGGTGLSRAGGAARGARCHPGCARRRADGACRLRGAARPALAGGDLRLPPRSRSRSASTASRPRGRARAGEQEAPERAPTPVAPGVTVDEVLGAFRAMADIRNASATRRAAATSSASRGDRATSRRPRARRGGRRRARPSRRRLAPRARSTSCRSWSPRTRSRCAARSSMRSWRRRLSIAPARAR